MSFLFGTVSTVMPTHPKLYHMGQESQPTLSSLNVLGLSDTSILQMPHKKTVDLSVLLTFFLFFAFSFVLLICFGFLTPETLHDTSSPSQTKPLFPSDSSIHV